MKKFWIILLLISTSTYSQSIYKFLNLDTSPRAAAVAGSFVSNNDDPNVVFYNPAGINFLNNSPISFSFLKHLMDINSASLVYSREFESIGRFSAAVKYINYGEFTKADANGTKYGNFGAGDIAFIVGYGNRLDQNFYYGANVKFIYSGIENYSSTALGVDLGLHYEIPDSKWNFGFSVLNLGGQLTSYIDTKEELPLDMRFGFSKQLENLPFRFFWSFNKLNEKQDNFIDRFKQITLGGEFKLGPSFRLRFGYDNEKRKELKIGTTAGLAGFSLGLGFNVSSYVVDYAFSSLGYIGSIHRFGISTNL
ncbi:MAG: type IX secretion system protein PorQ [Melioribacter sp.]|nr:type IX secretion system protein PorQ [Melioribacter sp.]